MSRGLGAGLALALALGGAGGCASIALNDAMEEVHYRYLDLFSEVEIRRHTGIRTAAEALLASLDAPAIARYSSEPEYQAMLGDTKDAVRQLVSLPDGEESLLTLRKRVFRSCDACHAGYRR